MYIFAEPVTEEQVAEIQNLNAAKIQEFEREILGLDRNGSSTDQDDQEEDGKWDNIQASVQKAMDEDELSIDEPNQYQEHQHEESGNEVLATDRQGGPEANSLPLSEPQFVTDESIDTATASVDVDDIVHQDSMEDGEENRDGSHDQESPGESYVDEIFVTQEITIDDSEPHESAKESATTTESPRRADSVDCGNGDGSSEQTTNESIIASSSTQNAEREEKAECTLPMQGEESSEAEHQTEADRPFLDSMDQEGSKADSSLPSSDVLAMTLTLRNKINDHFVHRPEQLSPRDKWSIEYSLVEVPNAKKATALYQACQLRRKKKLDSTQVSEESEFIDQYIANLRKMSAEGKKWRKKEDEKDSKRPLQVLGSEITERSGESRV